MRLGRPLQGTLAPLLLWASCVSLAWADEALQWLDRVAFAGRQLSYFGTIVYQRGTRTETSRIFHLIDSGVEFEKIVRLDGPPGEAIRMGEEVHCYLPEEKILRIDSRANRPSFPSLLPSQLATLVQNYVVRKAERTRVAGLEAQAYVFEPRDPFRYGHKFWSDVASGLLLKARMFDDRDETIEQSTFTEVQIGARIDKDVFKSSYIPRPGEWQVVRGARPASNQPTGWEVRAIPPGFSKVVEGWRKLPARQGPVAHLVFSDGLIAVSVFIEPAPSSPQPLGALQQGTINVYKRQLDSHLVTVLGETPPATVRQIAYSVMRSAR